MSSAKLIKSLVKKNVGGKSTFGTNPSDPWSAKANIAESASLNQYLLSRGINPKFVSKDTKVAHSKSNAFLKWQADHANRLGEETEEEVVLEATDKMDVIAMDIPFLIRMLEYAREDAKTDLSLHKVVEKLINIRKRGVMTMKNYKYVTSIRECVELIESDCSCKPKNEKEWKELAQKRGEELRQRIIKVDEAKEADYGYDYQRSVQTVKALAGKKPVDMKFLAARMQASYAKDEKKPVKEDILNEYGDTAKGQKMLSKVLKRAADRVVSKKADTDPKYAKKNQDNANAAYNRMESVYEANSYDDNRTGFAKKPRENDEGHAPTKFKAKSLMDRPHTVHIDGKAWKKFSNGHQANAAVKTLASKGKKATAIAHFKENTLDSMAATQAPNDCANSPDTTIPAGKKLIRMSKSAQIIKSAYGKGMKESVVSEEMYDHEKEDKSVSGLKKPKVTQPTEKAKFGEEPKAAIVMSGGKTMTGEPRDTIVIDPAMKGKPGGPNDPTVKK